MLIRAPWFVALSAHQLSHERGPSNINSGCYCDHVFRLWAHCPSPSTGCPVPVRSFSLVVALSHQQRDSIASHERETNGIDDLRSRERNDDIDQRQAASPTCSAHFHPRKQRKDPPSGFISPSSAQTARNARCKTHRQNLRSSSFQRTQSLEKADHSQYPSRFQIKLNPRETHPSRQVEAPI
jgi:hypothetical protein